MIKDFSKFKRLFVFGCSYTDYKWPTWAHVLQSEIEDCKLFNFGLTGCSNQLIALRVAEANKRYEFTENDLIVVMWTSFTREDRWINKKWLSPGNIYNQEEYPTSWVKKFCDPDFYLIRDSALIELTKSYLENLSCASFMMSSWPVNLLENNSIRDSFSPKILDKISKVYSSTINDLPVDLRTWQERRYLFNKHDPKFHLVGHTYTKDGVVVNDGHPNTEVYREYLEFVGFPMTGKSRQYANQCMEKLKKCKDDVDFSKHFPDEYSNMSKPFNINWIF